MPINNDQLLSLITKVIDERNRAQTEHFDNQIKELKDKVNPMFADYKNAKFLGRVAFGLGVIFGGTIATFIFDWIRSLFK